MDGLCLLAATAIVCALRIAGATICPEPIHEELWRGAATLAVFLGIYYGDY